MTQVPAERSPVDLAREGDAAAFASLVRERIDAAFRLALAILGDEEDAAGAVRETFGAAWRRLPNLPEREPFDAWLRRLAVSSCHATLRARGRKRVREIPQAELGAADEAMPESGGTRRWDVRMLRSTLRRFSVDQRAILALHYLEGMPVPEVAAVLAMPATTAASRLHKARTSLTMDDERLEAAYRTLAGKPAPLGLVESTLAACSGPQDRTGAQSRTFGALLRSPRGCLAGTALALALVAMLAAGLLLHGGPPVSTPSTVPASGLATPTATATEPAPAPPNGEPTTVDGLRVMSVSQALAVERTTGDDLVAIGGWYVPMPFSSCGGVQPYVTTLEQPCGHEILLTENSQSLVQITLNSDSTEIFAAAPADPYIKAVRLDGSDTSLHIAAIDDLSPSNFVPVRAIIVGHFHDARADLCSNEALARCYSEFVIDKLAYMNGTTYGMRVYLGTDSTGVQLQTRLTADGVLAALRPSLRPTDSVVSIDVANRLDMASITGPYLQIPGRDTDTLWFVRVAGPPPSYPPMAWDSGNGGWIILNDSTGRIVGAGGWGFVSDESFSFPPSPKPSMADGLFLLPTTNWLAGRPCDGIGVNAVLHGIVSDPRIAWLVDQVPNGEPRLEISWPAGYTARFNPNLEILDETGTVVLREGAQVTNACTMDVRGVYLQPPFK